MRRQFQCQADLFAFDGRERVDGTTGRAGIRETAGYERNFLADTNLGLFIVQGRQDRGAHDVRICIGFQRLDNRDKTESGIGEAA